MHRNLFLAAAALALFLLLGGGDAVQAQTQEDAKQGGERGYSESSAATRTRTATGNDDAEEKTPARILRRARTVYVAPTKHLDSKYLEYKLGKYAELQQWKLAIVKDRERADLVIEIHKRALNYIFSIEDPQSSVVVVNGKVVAINDLVAAEDIAREIIKRMKHTRALPVAENY